MADSCLHCFISGRVQGVFFRYSTRKQAKQLGVKGWVRNLPDGRVEVLACGGEHALAQLQAWLHQGPPGAQVAQVECHVVEKTETGGGFSIV